MLSYRYLVQKLHLNSTLAILQNLYILPFLLLLILNWRYKCGSRVAKGGHMESDFHAVYTDHRLQIQMLSCCNKDCSARKITTSIYSLFGSNMHPDLVKKQAELASEQSFIKAQERH